MALLDRIAAIEKTQKEHATELEELRRDRNLHDEQINGKRGLAAAIDANTAELKSVRRAAWWVAGVLITASIGFAFTILALVPV